MRKDFIALLREHSDIDRHCRWIDVKKKVDSDSRYRAVDNSMLREDYFHDYCKMLKDEKKRIKEKERERKEKKEREKREKEKERHKDRNGDTKEKGKDKEKRRESKDTGGDNTDDVAAVADKSSKDDNKKDAAKNYDGNTLSKDADEQVR